ncbi:hypothetical protein Tco_1032605, partial [Tanacetum coccineum]
MSNMSEDIQYAGSDTRPPMLDKTDFESWQQRIRKDKKDKKKKNQSKTDKKRKSQEKNFLKPFEEGEIHDDSVLYNDGCIKDCMEKNLEDDAGEILGVHSQGD